MKLERKMTEKNYEDGVGCAVELQKLQILAQRVWD